MPQNIIRTTVTPKRDMQFATESVRVPDNWSTSNIHMPNGPDRNVEWSFRAYAHQAEANYEPLDMKIRFAGQDGKSHEIVYEPQGNYGTFNGTDPQSYKFAAVSYDGVYKEPISGNLVNAKDGSPSQMSQAEFAEGSAQANDLLRGVAATAEFKEPNISVTPVTNDMSFGPSAANNGNTYTYRPMP